MKREINFIHKLKRPYKPLECDEKKLILAIFMSILVVIASFSYAIVKNDGVPKNKSLIAYKGLLDLESYDNLGDTLIELDGEWEFYNNEFIDVLNIRNDRDNFKNYKDIKEYIKVPGNWNNHISKDGTSEGFGTYRLRVKVPYEGSYGIKTSTIRGAAYIYLNGTLISSMGTPLVDRKINQGIGYNKPSLYI